MGLLYRKMKKYIVFAVTGSMIIGLLAGCSLSTTPVADDSTNVGIASLVDDAENAAEEAVTIIQKQYEDTCELGEEYVFDIAEFFSVEGIDIGELTVDSSEIDTEECGEYDIIVTYKDSYKATVKVAVADTICPELNLRNRIIYANQVDDEVLQLEYHVEFRDIQNCDIIFSNYAKYGDYDVIGDLSEEELIDEIETRYIDYPFVYEGVGEDTEVGSAEEDEEEDATDDEDVEDESIDDAEAEELEEGVYAVEVRVVDASGNISAIIAAFVYDCTPAEITGLRDQTVYQEDLNATPEFSVSTVTIVDNFDGEVDISDADVTLSTKNETNHTYSLKVTYTDVAGNTAVKESTVTVKKPTNTNNNAGNGNSAPTDSGNSGNSTPADNGNDGSTEDNQSSQPIPEPTPEPTPGSSDYMQRVLDLVNVERAAVGLPGLTLNTELCSNANVRAAEISTSFSHTRPDGSSCFTAITMSYWSAGENIAAGYGTPEAVVEGWMNSDGHRANILSSDFTQLGVGYYYDPNSGYGHYWVQMFIG